MKRIFVLATAAMLIAGVASADNGGRRQKKAKASTTCTKKDCTKKCPTDCTKGNCVKSSCDKG